MWLTLASTVWGVRPARAEGVVFGAAFTTLDKDGPLRTSPSGVMFGAALSRGAGVELRWAADHTYHWLTINFLQIAPAPRRGRIFQPFGSAGLTVVRGGGEPRVGFNFAGGAVFFLSRHLGVYGDYRYLKGPGTINGVAFLSRTFSMGAALRL